MTDPKKRHVTMFCGYGGSCSGAKAVGLECAIAIDNNDRIKVPVKAATINKDGTIIKVPSENGDESWQNGKEGVDWKWFERLPAIETREKNLKDGAGVVMGVEDFVPGPEHAARFVTASPPCKRFSTSAEAWDEDDQGLEALDKEIKELGFVAIEKALQIPEMEYYIMENVKGLLSEKNQPYLLAMVNMLRDKGFSVEWQIFNAHDFGAAQMRERLILIASKNKRKDLLPKNPSGVKKKVFKDIMEDGKNAASKLRIKESLWPQSTYLTFVAKMMRGAGQMKIVIPSRAEAEAKKWEKIALDAFPFVDVLPTIACNAGGGPTRKKWAVLPFNGHGYRNATLLEGLRAQDHDDSWLDNLPQNAALAWNMIGNAVPRCLMAGIMRHLMDLDNFYDGKGARPPARLSLNEADKLKMSASKLDKIAREEMPTFFHVDSAAR